MARRLYRDFLTGAAIIYGVFCTLFILAVLITGSPFVDPGPFHLLSTRLAAFIGVPGLFISLIILRVRFR